MSQNREVKATNISAIESNISNHEGRLEALESNIETTNLITDAEQKFAKIIAGGDDNIAKFWKVRHHVMMASIGNGQGAEGADFEGNKFQDRFIFDPNFTQVSSITSTSQFYLSGVYYLEQNEQLQFKIKKGENFFCIGVGYLGTTAASVFRVYVDNVNVNTLGLKDENDNIVPSSFSANQATTVYGKLLHFYGLDGEEHIVTIKNENASALEVPVSHVDVGYRSPDYAIDHTMRINSGMASVNGVPTSFNEGTFTFARPGDGLANGYTGMVKINQSGTLTAVNGLSPAATQIKPQYTIPFASGPVTTLPVKNVFPFPSNGICLFQHPAGETFVFSYNGKTDTTPQAQSLNNIVWQSQPRENYTPLVRPVGTKEVWTITNTNPGSFFDVAGAAKKVVMYSARPEEEHYFWFKVTDGVNTQVDPGVDYIGHQVDLLTADTANQVAAKLQAAINALTDKFTASVSTNVVTVTNKHDGAVANAVTSTSGMTVATTVVGVTPSYAANGFKGDARIEYWAKAPIQISNSNNKVDFQIIRNGGAPESATATLANGFYSADLIPLEKAFVEAMTAALSIKGTYFLKYNKESQYWTIGVNGDEQTEIRFLFATGANAANSIASTLGFTGDKTGKRSYLADTDRQHLAQRVFVQDQNFRSTEHPSIKYTWALTGQVNIPEADQLLVDLGLPSYRRQASSGNAFYIFPDDDCCGLTLSFMREDVSVYVAYQIDDGDVVYLAQMDRPSDSVNPPKGALINTFISFPKGSRKITIRPEAQGFFQNETATTPYITFFGYRQWFTKPPWETLTLTEKILRTVEVNPIRLFVTNYGHNTDLYRGFGTNDNINSVVESGVKERTNFTNTNVGSFFDVVGAARKFNLFAAPLSTTGEQHYFWFNVTDGPNTQTDPGGPGIGHQVDLVMADTAIQVMEKLRDVINSLPTKFSAVLRNPASAVLTVENVYDGAVTNASQGAVTSGFTIAVEIDGLNHGALTAFTSAFNRNYRSIGGYGAYIDINFTLQGDGGGIGFLSFDSTGTSQVFSVYLSNTTINEDTDLIELGSADAATIQYDHWRFLHLGLKAGTYTLRLKNDHSQVFVHNAICVIDTVAPQVDATTHSDLVNAGQGLSYPYHVRRRNLQRYGINKQPSWLTEGLARTGLVNMTDYLTNTHNVTIYDDSTSVLTQSNRYFSINNITVTNGYVQMPFIGRSCAIYGEAFSTYSASATPSVDSVVSSNISLTECVKGGLAPSATRGSTVRNFVKDFTYPASHSGGLTFTMLNTQGLRQHQKVILIDNLGNREEAYIASFISNTSFTIKKALTVISAANVTKIEFPGFHIVKLTSNNATSTPTSAIEYEPLPLEWSILEDRVSTVTVQEIKELNFILAVPSQGVSTTTATPFEYPFHSDGEQGTPLTSEIEFLRPQDVNASPTGGTSRLDRGLKSWIVVTGGGASASADTVVLNIRSRRNIVTKSSIGLVRG